MLKSFGPTLGRIILSVFAVAVFALMIVLTFGALGKIFPNDVIKQIAGLLLFDIGAVAWLVIFVSASRGAMQRSIAILTFIYDLLGTIGMASSEAIMGGQHMVAVPIWLTQGVVYLFIASTAINLISVYCHHITAPHITENVRLQAQQDKLRSAAIDTAEQKLDDMSEQLANRLADRHLHDALLGLNLLGPGDTNQPPTIINLPSQTHTYAVDLDPTQGQTLEKRSAH